MRLLLSRLGHWLDVGTAPSPTDYCLVLSGDFESRPFVAAALYAKGYIRRDVWLTHAKTGQPVAGEPGPEAAARKILVALGTPAERIAVLNGDCESTFDEAQVLANRLSSEPSATVTIVTSDFHTRRSSYIFRKVVAEQADRLRFVSVPTDYFNADNWWTSEEGFSTYSKEILKLPFYFIRYGGGWIWIAVGCVAAFAATQVAQAWATCNRHNAASRSQWQNDRRCTTVSNLDRTHA